MSRLTPGLIALDKGLDLNTAKIAAPEGTLLDTLNYEQVDFQGQKRIDGYVRYDGGMGSYQDDLYVIDVGAYIPENTILTIDGRLSARAVLNRDGLVYVALLDHNVVPTVGSTLNGNWTVNSVAKIETALTPEDGYESILNANHHIREATTTLPGPVAGLHWFNDRLYAVASLPTVPDQGFMPNDNYGGSVVLKVQNGQALIGSANSTGSIGEVASLFQSRTEQQALDELGSANSYGWEFVHQGWHVPFENGVSPFGKFIALNMNRQGVGIEGPSSTEGDRGRPLLVTQKVDILNRGQQVNGWKSSQAPNAYSISAAEVKDIDDMYLYADAHIAWDGESDVITYPGVEGGVLVEYPANATINVTNVENFVEEEEP